jgi:hypothetical protein
MVKGKEGSCCTPNESIWVLVAYIYNTRLKLSFHCDVNKCNMWRFVVNWTYLEFSIFIFTSVNCLYLQKC